MQLKTSTLASLFMIMLFAHSVESSEPVEPSKSLEKAEPSAESGTLVPASGPGSSSTQAGASVEPIPRTGITSEDFAVESFENAVKGNILGGIVLFFGPIKSIDKKRHCLRLLLTLGSKRFATVLQKVTKDDKTLYLTAFRVIFTYAEQEFIDDIFQYFQSGDEFLYNVATDADLACNPERFVALLRRISTVDSQVTAVMHGVMRLSTANKIEFFTPLLSRLEDETSLDLKLVDSAISTAFLQDLRPIDGQESFTRLYVDHPSVSSSIYLIALFNASNMSRSNSDDGRFYWLLERADLKDLETISNVNPLFSSVLPKHQDAVRSAMTRVGSKNRCAERRKKRIGEVRKVFEFPEDPISIIGAYDV